MSKRKVNVLKRNSMIIFILFLMFIGGFYIYQRTHHHVNRYYSDFGIRIPKDYSIHGIDVSRYQKNISWKEVKKMKSNNIKIGFAFMKATEGTDRIDRHYNENWVNVKQAGITRGAYHFFNAHSSGKTQAENFIQNVFLTSGDLPPVLDIENTDGVSTNELQINIKEWLTIIEQHYKVKPIIYTYADFYAANLSVGFDEYPLWVAHYVNSNKPRINRNWHFWQHNETGRVNGINAPVDFNVFNGDSAAFKNLLMN